MAGRRLNLDTPADYEIEFLDSNTVLSENAFGLSSRMVNVMVNNITDSKSGISTDKDALLGYLF